MKPGVKLWRVPNMGGHSSKVEREVTVVKVGRRWAMLDNGERCLLDPHPFGCHPVDGKEYISPASCWPDRKTYEDAQALHRAWSLFREHTHQCSRAPDGITMEAIQTASKLLFGETA